MGEANLAKPSRDESPAVVDAIQYKMNKAVYAFAFLGLCAVVLVLHTNQSVEEDTLEAVPQDPFLANLEAHVIAKAQRRLRQRAMAHKRKNHISNARKAMKTMLLNAASQAQDNVAKVEKEEALKRQKDKKKSASKANKKQFTWAQLQKGEDNAKQNYANQKMGSLLNKLKSAPKADKKKRLQDAQVKQEQKSNVMANALAAAKKKAKDDIKKKDVFA